MKRTGDEYFDSEEFRELLDSYEESVSSGSSVMLDSDELTDIADYYHYTGDYDKADEAITQALDFFPGATAPLIYKAHEALDDDDVTTAEEYIAQIEDKESPDYQYMKAEVLIAQDKIDEAEQFLRQYFWAVPADEHNDFVIDVANIYMDYGVTEKAYEWMMRSQGDHSENFKELMGHILLALGKFEDSQRIFNELLDRDPYSSRYWNSLASAQYMSEDYSNSISSSEYAIAIDPTNPDSLINKANGLLHLNNYEEALKYYERYTDVNGEDDYSAMNKGICLLSLNRQQEALQMLKKAEELTNDSSPCQIQIYQELAFAYSSLHDVENAIKSIDKTQLMDCDHADMEVLKGHVLLENGQMERAHEAFKEAIIKSGYSPEIMIRIIVSIYDNRLVHAAYTLFKSFYKNGFDDDYPYGHAYMALCCWDLKKYDEFMEYLKLSCERRPQEARIVLGHLFPENLEPKDYYEYMTKEMNL